ncbi:MAG TPA: carboxypeptidase regulatory-like domain-containing protein, partial [Vicinamibacterales bacterium]|nr:carboxypeptidase regulatory-like domain-containing protein [Vicinamibacterales bacterium]
MYARISALLVAIALAATGLVSAQERFGTLTGTVTDAQGGAIPGVTVVATNVQTGEVRSFVTDASGQFRAPDLLPGRYTIRFELTGFAPVERTDVIVLLGRAFELNAEMRVGGVAETVQVVAETPLVDTRSTMIAHNVTAEEFDRLPKGRSFQSVAMTAPSVNNGVIEGGLQVNGASGSENQFTVDGVATNSLLNGQSRQDTVFEYLQEVQVKTVGITAEYGGALGGVISAVTKSGGNTFRGEGHYYYSGSALGGAPVERLVLSPVDDLTVSYVQDEEQKDNRNEIGGSLGGPIVRDKLFFFGSYSPRFLRRTNEYAFSNGTETGDPVDQKQTATSAYGKVSYASRRLNAYFGALFTPTETEGTLLAYTGLGPQYTSTSRAAYEPNRTRGSETTQRNLTGNADITLTNATFLSVKAGSFYDNYADTGVSTTTPYRYRTSTVGVPGVPASLQGGVLASNTPAVRIVDYDTTKQSYIQADYNAAFTASGFHTLKVGTGFRRNSNDVDQRFPGGLIDVYWGSTFTSSVPGVGSGRGTYGYYEVHDDGTFGKTSSDIVHLYAQDQWSLGNLTLNLGIRFENETIPSFRQDLAENAIEFGFGDKVAPRIGASYDVFGDGRMKLFGAYGRYYDWTKYELARGSFGGDIWQVYYRSLDDPNWITTANLNNMPGRDLWGSASGFRDRRVPAFDTIDPDIKPMSQDSYNAGVEYQLGRTSVFTVNYIHNSLVRTIEDIGLLVNGDEVYLYANPGEGLATNALVSTATAPFNIPKPVRQYDALQFELTRRFSNNWFFSSSYVWSRLYGNYPG